MTDEISAEDRLDAALSYAAHGWRVVPVYEPRDGRCACKKGVACNAPGKHPWLREWPTKATTEVATIWGWFRERRTTNWGIVTGAASGIIALDIDPRHGGDESLARLEARHGPLPRTVRQQTGGGGQHILLKHPGFRVGNQQGTTTLAPGIDVRGDGGQILVEPSDHVSGGRYRWEVAHHPDDVPVADAPPWLLAMLQAPAHGPSPGPAPPMGARIPDGARNGTLASLAGTMRRKGMSADAMAAALLVENTQRCDPPLPDDDVRAIAASVARYTPAPPTPGHEPASVPTPPPWPTPQPVTTARPPVAPFDIAALMPAPFASWVRDVAERLQCPPDYVAITVMVAAGSVIGRQCGVRPKRYDDWEVVPNLWGLAIGSPGIMKSPAIKEGLRPLRRLIAAEMERYQIAMRDARFIRMKREAREKRLKKLLEEALEAAQGNEDAPAVLQIRDALRVSDEPLPTERLYRTNDATVEKVAVLLHGNPNGFLVDRDEIGGLIKTMDREGHQNDRAFYEECWNGSGSYRVDRIERGTLYVEAACLSLFGGIQPAPLDGYLREWERRGLDDGFIQRFQLMVYPDVTPFRRVDRWVDSHARETATQAFRAIDRLDPQRLHALTHETDARPYLNFDDDAQAVFDSWYDTWQARLRSETWPLVLRQHFAKYPSLVPALALIDHLVAGGTGPIPARCVTRALAWATYLASHARRVYAPLPIGRRGRPPRWPSGSAPRPTLSRTRSLSDGSTAMAGRA